MVDNDKQSSIPLQSMQRPEDVDDFSPNDTLEIKYVLYGSFATPRRDGRTKGLTSSCVVFGLGLGVAVGVGCRGWFGWGLMTGWNRPARSLPQLNPRRLISPHG